MKASQSKVIPYEVIRSRRSTADIIIERDGNVLVRAPEWADDEQVANIVESKYHWIYQGLAEWRDLNATRIDREYKNGEGFLYLGRAYRLLIVNDQSEALQLKDDRFTLRRDLIGQGEIEAGKAAFRDFYIAKGLKYLRTRLDYYAPKVGVDPAGLEVRDLGYRWGSCSPKRELSFHWKCMMAPPTIIDYVVVHELCHFHYRDHTLAFWNEVDKVLPDFGERREWLRKNGASLDA